jgi:hypothetical protein
LAGVGIFVSLITHFFSLYFCVTPSHGSLWHSVWRCPPLPRPGIVGIFPLGIIMA